MDFYVEDEPTDDPMMRSKGPTDEEVETTNEALNRELSLFIQEWTGKH